MTKNKNKPIKIGILVLMLALLVGIFFYHQAYEHSLPKLRAKIGSNADFYDKKDLAKHDYVAYQSQVLNYAQYAVSVGDYSDANRLTASIIKNVPPSQISRWTYLTMALSAKQTHNQAAYVKYTKALIAQLKKDGYTNEASNYQNQLNKAQ